MPTVNFVNEKKKIEVPQGANLRKEALKAGIPIHPPFNRVLNCKGLGSCGTCRVLVRKGVENVSKQGLREKLRFLAGPLLFFARLGKEDQLRLACQTKVNGDCEIETQPDNNWHGEKFWA